MAAYMSNKGSLNGKKLISEDTWTKLHSNLVLLLDRGFSHAFTYTNFTAGGIHYHDESCATARLNNPVESWLYDGLSETRLNNNRTGFYGWQGIGGSVMQWNPETKIGFGYVTSNMNLMDHYNTRGALL